MTKSLKQIALIVSLGTLLSKAGGLIRQLVIAAAFGVGAAYDAYNYAYVIPGFFLILLGGINGPFHTAMVSALSRRSKEEINYILVSLNTIISLILIIITAFLFFAADPLIHLIGPGLNPELHQIAVIQLRLMSPMALLAGLIGLGFGVLNASEEFWIPAISPLMSSFSLITGVIFYWILIKDNSTPTELAIKGGIILAIATLAGSLLQWFIQLPSLIKNGLTNIKFIWDLNHPGVKEVFQIIAPASLASGMLQINVVTDLFFASGIVGAAAGLSYATLLVQAPLGLISNTLLVPLLPTYAKLRNIEQRSELIKRIRQGLIFSSSSMIALGALFISLGGPIVSLIYQRGAFEKTAVELVAGLLIAYGIGMPFYLGRDLLIRIFYALGDGQTPFKISTLGIAANIIFDWFLIGGPSPWGNQLPFNFGAQGLVLATAAVNLFTCFALLRKLNQKLNGLPLTEWSFNGLKLIFVGISSGWIAWGLETGINWPPGVIGKFAGVGLSSAISLGFFGLASSALGVSDINNLLITIKRKITLP